MDRYSNGLKNPAPMYGGAKDLPMYFGRLKLGTDGNLEPPSQTCNNKNASSSSSSSSSVSMGVKDIKNQTQENQENPVSPPRRSIWGQTFFYTDLGEGSASNAAAKDDYFIDYFKDENFDFGSSNHPPTLESNCLSQFNNNRFVMPVYKHESDGFMQTTNSGLHYGNYYSTMNNGLSSNSKWNQPKPKPGFFQEIQEGGNYEWIETPVQYFRGRFLSLMTHHNMSIIFQKLVDACNDEQLQVIVEEVLSSGQMLVDAAFCYPGANSISRLIKKIKRSLYAFSVTNLLSTRFWPIMTHDIARRVIQDCFIHFGHQPNKILYEEAVSHLLELAVHKVGCRALNELINTISSDQRSRLLNDIADHSTYLSTDQYGNYVVQTVLSLKKQDVNERIMVRLRGSFVELAKTTGGSHVVEKCIESSDYGIETVVKEILEDPRAPLGLALDEFGNYVIQKALKMTKERGFRELYRCLVIRLWPYHDELHHTAGGKKVLHLMRNEGWMR